ncbi:MAG: hypothetical protein WC810_25930, partial [Janthinobacterium sp.]
MNVDVSPDGKTLLFDLLGDIYSVPATGGKAKQLTRGIALHLRPKWAPDGNRFGFLSDTAGGIRYCIQDLKGNSTISNLATAATDSFSSEILWGAEINDENGSTIFPFDISRDKVWGYFYNEKGYFRYHYGREKMIPINPADLPNKSDESVSPDGKWNAIIKEDEGKRMLVVKNNKDGNVRILVRSLFPKPYSYKPDVPPVHFSFSPDSKNIFIGYRGKIHKINIETGKDNVIPFKAAVKSDMGSLVYNKFKLTYDDFSIRYSRSALLSPDSKYLLFSALGVLYRMDLPMGKPYPVIAQSCNQFQPAFSPDGKWITYVTWNDSIGGGLWKLAVTGGKPVK